MNALIKSTGDNTVGIAKIQYVAVRDIAFFPPIDTAYGYAINVLDIGFTADSGLLEMITLPITVGSGKMKQEDKLTDNGKVFSQNVYCTAVLDGGYKIFDNNTTINELDANEFIVVATKYDGAAFIFGTIENPMKLSINNKSEGLGTGSNNYEFSFSVDSPKRAPSAVFY